MRYGAITIISTAREAAMCNGRNSDYGTEEIVVRSLFIDRTDWFYVMLHDLEKLRQLSSLYESFSLQGCQFVFTSSVCWDCVL